MGVAIKFNTNIKGIGVREVEGKFTKLKGYSKFIFFSYKIDKTWSIREFSTGREVGSSNTEVNAKKEAKTYLKEYSQEQIQLQVDSIEFINKE